jgi:DNA-directed RNA polymerase subunit L
MYASNITYPTGREYIGFKKEYDIDELEQKFALWKQKMIEMSKALGVYLGPVKNAKTFATLSKIKFKNKASKMITALGYVIEKEFVYNDGVDFIVYKRGTQKDDKVYFRIKKHTDVTPEEMLKRFLEDIKDKGKFKMKNYMTCGKYSKKAKEFAEKYNIKLYDDNALTKILKKLAELERK